MTTGTAQRRLCDFRAWAYGISDPQSDGPSPPPLPIDAFVLRMATVVESGLIFCCGLTGEIDPGFAELLDPFTGVIAPP